MMIDIILISICRLLHVMFLLFDEDMQLQFCHTFESGALDINHRKRSERKNQTVQFRVCRRFFSLCLCFASQFQQTMGINDDDIPKSTVKTYTAFT